MSTQLSENIILTRDPLDIFLDSHAFLKRNRAKHSRNKTRAMSTPNKAGAGAGAKTMSSRLANMKVGHQIRSHKNKRTS